jgi:hypothetical protein
MFLLKCLSITVAIIHCTVCAIPGQSNQHVQPYKRNPSYWQYKGQPVLLVGGTRDDNLFQIENLKSHLDSLRNAGGNYIRNTMSDRDPGNARAFLRNSEGKYDLEQWDESYWTRFRDMLELTRVRDIIVQIEVWDRFDHSRAQWESDPYNPRNNINYTHEQSRLDSIYPLHPGSNKQPFFYTVPALHNNTTVLKYQQAFVKKLLSIALAHDHVLYCIDNETKGDEAWAIYWADFIKENAQGRPVFVTQMWDDWDVKTDMHKRTIDHPARYDYIDLSQNSQLTGYNNWKNQQYVFDYIRKHPRPVNSTKIYGSDVGPWLNRGITSEHAIQSFFRNILGGFASSRFHRPPAGLGLSERCIQAIKTIRKIEEYVKMWELSPRMDLLDDLAENQAYLAAREGDTYLVYFTKGGSAKLDLTRYPKKFSLRWISVGNAAWGKVKQLEGGKVVTLEAPDDQGTIAMISLRR